ncbi:MAG: DUF342 domain-containing protein [Desulfuromonadales bacterium]|nr:DUF342 domain-containing protein [Desulfuromonadales bacterium]
MIDVHNSTASLDEPNLLFVEENERYRLCLSLTKQQMECLAEIEIFPSQSVLDSFSAVGRESDLPTADEFPPLNDSHENIFHSSPFLSPKAVITPPDLFWFLHQNNIIKTIDYPAIYELCAAIEMGLSLEPTVVARGIAPQTGADGWFELNVKISGDDIELEEDETGTVDLKNLNAYSEIESGQKLGMVRSPTKGIPGLTVHGLPVPADSGKPFELKAGEGVVLKYDGRVAFAEKSGRALLEKQTISVVDLLVIPGNVDLTIGNIDFKGFVEIKGEVPDDFDVKSTSGLNLAGVVGACQIESDGSVGMTSMAGKNVGRIVCRGDLRASFLNQATVLCYGDVTVTNEIRHSLVKATGKIIVERGPIIGGKCVALAGIEAKSVGSAAGHKTELVAGVYFPDMDRLLYLRDRSKNIDLHIRSVIDAIKPLKQLITKDTGIAIVAKRRLAILHEQLAKLEEENYRVSAEKKSSPPQKPVGINPKINIHNKLLEGVKITLGSSCEEIKIERRGPLSIIENTVAGGFRYLGLSKLAVTAGIIEQEMFAEVSDSDTNSED